ncbi:MAG: hypothetical protein JWM27_1420 [Gemmatimonadetes bacterium]|nr:hypothetical protein [Gemmatimonadota bacterium]
MRRVVAMALGAALACVTTGQAAQAQGGWLRRDARLDLAAYAGGSYGTDWFTLRSPAGADQPYRPGYGPIFGVAATWWATPHLGLRGHAAYVASDLPDASSDVIRNGSFGSNQYLYDLALSYRPWIARASAPDWLASTYLFAGGGGSTTSVAGAEECARPYPAAVCLSTRASDATVGAGVVGAGMDMYPMSRTVTLFGEGAVHAYSAPVRVDEAAGARRHLAFTPRVVGGVRVALGGRRAPVRPAVKPPFEPPHPVPVDTAPPPRLTPEPPMRDVRVCIVHAGTLAVVPARVNAAGDTLLADGRSLADAYPPGGEYASGRAWFVSGTALARDGVRYEKLGLPRVLGADELRPAWVEDGVPVFVPAGGGAAEVVYLPTRPGCEFQPYQRRDVALKVRG